MLIDAGHGGSDAGAVSGTILEKNLALDYALKIGHFAKAAGRAVGYTRTEDKFVELNKRSRMVKPNEILISCHLNSVGNPKARGCSVWYHGRHEESYKLAVCIMKRINSTHLFKQYSSGVISDYTRYPPRPGKTGGFAMTREAAEIGARAAVLLEPCFLSNPEDRKVILVEKNRLTLAAAVNDGITDYLNLVKKNA